MTKTKVIEKWSLKVYGPDAPRYREGNLLWFREYHTRASANRAAANVRKMYPGSIGELSRFEATTVGGFAFWHCRGVHGEDVFPLWGAG